MLPWWEVIGRLALAIVLGSVVGFEREVRGKPAGLRTNALASLGAAIYVLAATQAASRFETQLDLGRLMAGIAQGVGFLGAGLILQSRRQVRGLTTAAALWAAAGIGLAVGLGSYIVAVVGSVSTLLVLRFLGTLESGLPESRTTRGSSEDD